MTIPLILTTSLICFSLKGWENVLSELGSERDIVLLSIVISFVQDFFAPIFAAGLVLSARIMR